MKRESLVTKTWDDLVFENKNKEYGAYLVRQSYSKNMMTGLGLSVALAGLLLILPHAISKLTGTKVAGPFTEILPDLPTVDFIQPPPLDPLPPPEQTVVPPQTVNSNLPPEVTTEPVDTELLTNDQITATMVEPGTGGGVPSTTGTGTAVTEVVIAPPTVVNFAEVMPAYDGGVKEMMKFIQRKTRYPSIAERNKVEGTVFVSFVVDKDGNVTDVQVVKGISLECDKEAARVIALMKDWTAGMQNHRAVSVRMTLPIKFQLADR